MPDKTTRSSENDADPERSTDNDTEVPGGPAGRMRLAATEIVEGDLTVKIVGSVEASTRETVIRPLETFERSTLEMFTEEITLGAVSRPGIVM